VHSTGANPLTLAFGLDYKVPDALVLLPAQAVPEPEQADVPAWVDAWSDARLNVAILAVLLVTLTLIFAFQARLVRHRVVHRLVRNGYLLVVLVWLGWTAGAQLSIVNVINYVMALTR
jgi:NosR/NirI family nitrous oxide reductase transcriptional regulator